jgi:glycosyltransferase involved in cell wall biosynthesis
VYVQLAKRMKDLGVRFLYVGGMMNDSVIHSLGFQWNAAALSQIYNNSHVLLNPSRADTFSRVSIESMACGTPVITSQLPVHEGLNLPFVFGNSIQDYENSILDLKSQWEAGRPYRQLSGECNKAAQAYSFKGIVSAYEGMFSRVAQDL